MPGTVRVALLYPPVTDPTSGYHSLTYLDSYARAQGYPAADIVDANIEAFHYTFSPAGVRRLTDDLAGPRAGARYLDPADAAAHDLRVGAPDPDGVREAVAILRDPDRFYRIADYRRAVEAVTAWMTCLGATGVPGQFRNGFEVRLPAAMNNGELSALTDLDLLAQLSRPFQGYYEEVLLPRLAAGGYRMIGLNITYHWQLPFALWLIRLIRRALPDVFLVAGGTEVSDVWKYARTPQAAHTVFADLDAMVVGEGETAYTAILDALAEDRAPVGHPNVVTHPRHGGGRALPMLRYERLPDLPTPDFSGLPWDLYLSPERFVYYSPTRGCYWNKCTFCDYGLNTDGPTSPWRQSPVDLMIRDVTALSRTATFIYFAVDVLAPATILRFAEEVVRLGLDIRWGAEIRLEKYWSVQRCELLRRSGCVAVSVGFESANQRILDLIDKGTTPAQVRQTMEAMTKAGIAVQVMGFTGFPTETAPEAQDSIDFLVENRDLWTFGGLGEFALTGRAIVAKEPHRFGVVDVEPPAGADIVRQLRYVEPVSQGARESVTAAKTALKADGYDRPWVGGTDTPHSYFYHERYGTAVRAALRSDMDDGAGYRYQVNGEFIARPGTGTVEAYQRLYGVAGRTVPDHHRLFRRRDGNILALPPSWVGLVALYDQPRTLADASGEVWMADRATTAQLWSLFIRKGVIRRRTGEP